MRTPAMERLNEPALIQQVGSAVREVLAALSTLPPPEEIREMAGRLARYTPYVAEHIRSLPAQRLSIQLRGAVEDLNEAASYLQLPEITGGGRRVLEETARNRIASARWWLTRAMVSLEEWEGGKR